MTIDVDISGLNLFARHHHGLFRLGDAAAHGVNRRRLSRLVEAGWCERTRKSVYRVRGAPTSHEQAMLAAVWFSGSGAVASHRAGGSIWGTPGYRSPAPEVSKPRGQSQRREYGRVHGSLWLPPRHRTIRFGIPVTTPARTVFDLAGIQRKEATERVLDHMLHTRLCAAEDVHAVFFALARRGRRGTVVMRDLLAGLGEGYVPPASELERRARKLIHEAGLPTPAFEVEVGGTDWIGRVDCLWRSERVVVELDGRRYHGGMLARAADRRRDNALAAAGWRVLRITWDDLVERPGDVVCWLRRALAQG